MWLWQRLKGEMVVSELRERAMWAMIGSQGSGPGLREWHPLRGHGSQPLPLMLVCEAGLPLSWASAVGLTETGRQGGKLALRGSESTNGA